MTGAVSSAHDRAIIDQFTRQASGFAARPELHADQVIDLIVEAAALTGGDRAIDLACGPGSVACALAARAAHVTGLDATPAMLDQARKLAQSRKLANVDWVEGSIYAVPFEDGAFSTVTCRFAFHHLEDPLKAFLEMVRLTAVGGRIVLCDGLASDDPVKARAFNTMERQRDSSTVAFRTMDDLAGLFAAANLGAPTARLFRIPYLADDLVRASFPEGDDRTSLLSLIESSVEGDALGMDAQVCGEGVRVSYPSVVLSAIKSA